MGEASASVVVRGSGSAYEIVVESGGLSRVASLVREKAPAHRYAVISDSNVAPLYGERTLSLLRAEGLEAELFSFPAGEHSKVRAQWVDLTDRLLASGLGRDSAVVAVGGGVTGDLAGFVAATYMRGIPVVQVPTSLVAMVDASVGGKTGVDAPAGKNLIGAFHQPALVLADPEVLATLPPGNLVQGLAEVVKHAAIADSNYLDLVLRQSEPLLRADTLACESLVLRSVQIKAEVVSQDEREGGLREVLNFGHTLGHALEAASDFELSHGEAVALGMVGEARLGEVMGITEPGTTDLLVNALNRLGLPTSLDGRVSVERALSFIERDKKVRSGEVRCVLLKALGRVASDPPRWSCAVEWVALDSALREL